VEWRDGRGVAGAALACRARCSRCGVNVSYARVRVRLWLRLDVAVSGVARSRRRKKGCGPENGRFFQWGAGAVLRGNWGERAALACGRAVQRALFSGAPKSNRALRDSEAGCGSSGRVAAWPRGARAELRP
jgi:hypothetical protein